MKKGFILLGFVAVFALASCNKEKECACSVTTSFPSDLGLDSETTSLPDQTTKSACSDLNTTINDLGKTITTTCVEK